MVEAMAAAAARKPNNASSPRDTQYEWTHIQQGPNSFYTRVIERGVHGTAPVAIDLHEDAWSPEELQLAHDFGELIERKYAEAHKRLEDDLEIQGLKAPREKVHAFVKQVEMAKIESAQEVQRANEARSLHHDAVTKAAAAHTARQDAEAMAAQSELKQAMHEKAAAEAAQAWKEHSANVALAKREMELLKATFDQNKQAVADQEQQIEMRRVLIAGLEAEARAKVAALAEPPPAAEAP